MKFGKKNPEFFHDRAIEIEIGDRSQPPSLNALDIDDCVSTFSLLIILSFFIHVQECFPLLKAALTVKEANSDSRMALDHFRKALHQLKRGHYK